MDRTPDIPAELPDDVEALKALVRDLSLRYQTKIDHLQEQLNLLLHKRFAPSSEKVSPDQLRLFNEAEATEDETMADSEAETSDIDASIEVPGHQRRRGIRKPLPETLPRIRIEHDLAEHEKQCTCGCQMQRIGELISEQLDIIPAQVRVLQHVRAKYACKGCETSIKSAPLPPQPLPKSNASPGLLAHLAVAKYQDALPLYRQVQILQRIGVDLPRATLAQWMIKLGAMIQPLINLLHDRLLNHDIVQMDETTIQVLREAGRKATAQSYMWVQRGGPPGQRILLFDYDPSRSQVVPARLLEGFKGYLQCDGYEAYRAVCQKENLIQVGCWAHARRKFDEAIKAQGKKGKPKAGRASKGVNFIQKLYRIERLHKHSDPDTRKLAREEFARPILDQMRQWLDTSLTQVPPNSAVGKALHYLNHQWRRLVRYLDDGRLAIDNNATENAIRPFVVGRKNWLFSATPKGAKASANLYSLIETAKANGLEPYHYLRRVFEELPKATTLEEIEMLLPVKNDTDESLMDVAQ